MKPMLNPIVIIYIKINFIMFFIIVDTPTSFLYYDAYSYTKKQKQKNYDTCSIAHASPQLMMT